MPAAAHAPLRLSGLLLPSPAEAIRNERDPGDGGEKSQDRDDDDWRVIEVLVLAIVHDVERPEKIIDAPKIRAARGHLPIVGADIEARSPGSSKLMRQAGRAARYSGLAVVTSSADAIGAFTAMRERAMATAAS